MIDELVKKEIIEWSKEMLTKYEWLRVKFEFNAKRGVYLVSFSPKSQILLSDEFNLEAMRFEDELNDRYGDDAPLFTDEEELFELSDNAVVIEKPYVYTSAIQSSYSFESADYIWSDFTEFKTSKVNSNCHPNPEDSNFAFAA